MYSINKKIMKTLYEQINSDTDSSFKIKKQRVKSDAFLWDFHYHPEIEIVSIPNGIGRKHVGNHLSYYQNGDLVLIGSNVPHSGFGYGAIEIHEETFIQFKENFLGDAFFDSIEFKKIKKLLNQSLLGISFVGKTKLNAEKLINELLELNGMSKIFKLLELLNLLADSEDAIYLNSSFSNFAINTKHNKRLQVIFEFVEKQYEQKIDSEEIADLVNMTLPAFCNFFKKQMNCTLTDFVNEYRINQSCKLFILNKNVGEVCYKTGFNDVSYFSRTFKKFKGISPKKYLDMLST